MSASVLARLSDYLYSEPVFTASTERRLLLAPGIAGWVAPALAEALLTLAPRQAVQKDGTLHLRLHGSDYASRTLELQAIALVLRDHGLVAGWRDEAMVLLDAQGAAFAEMERAALRALGLPTRGVHLNALVPTAQGVHMWIAERSRSKAVDPGLLDNLVGGGVIGQESIAGTLVREAWEEAGLHIPHTGSPRSRLHILRRSAHGIQDETLYVYDRWLPAHFLPENRDGELAATQRLPLPDVLELLQKLHFTRDAALVILDGLCRQWFFAEETPGVRQLLRAFGLYGQLP